MRVKTKYLDDECELMFARYKDGSICIGLMSAEGPAGRVTVCLADANMIPEPGNIFVKNWSENEGMLEAMQDLGVIGPVVNETCKGSVHVYECRLLVEPTYD